jgi:replication factor C subunit 3/5
VLARSGKKEGWPLASELNLKIAKDSGRNLRRALLMYEAVHAQK